MSHHRVIQCIPLTVWDPASAFRRHGSLVDPCSVTAATLCGPAAHLGKVANASSLTLNAKLAAQLPMRIRIHSANVDDAPQCPGSLPPAGFNHKDLATHCRKSWTPFGGFVSKGGADKQTPSSF